MVTILAVVCGGSMILLRQGAGDKAVAKALETISVVVLVVLASSSTNTIAVVLVLW